MGRIGRGWQLSKESWAIVKADRSLLVFPVVAGISALIVAIVFGGAALGVYDASDSEPLAIAIGVVGLYVLIAISIFCNVALTACAARSLEGLTPWAALKRSVAIIKERWGEGVAGSFAIGGLVFLFAFLPGAILVGLGIAVGGGALTVVLILLGVAVFAVGAAVQTALMAVFKVALFRFATEDRVVGQYERPLLESAFRPRGRAARAAGI